LEVTDCNENKKERKKERKPMQRPHTQTPYPNEETSCHYYIGVSED